MSIIRRRYYTWLIRAYIKRWYKAIISSILVGVAVFFAFAFIINFYILPLIEGKVQKIGYWGTYTTGTVPDEILSDISYGLTRVDKTGTVSGGAAYKWEVKNDGREYIFYIKRGQYFHNDQELTAENLHINFKDVKKKIIDDYTVSLILKDSYSPFLTSLSRPIFGKNFSGLGEFKARKIDLNAGFVRSITLVNKTDPSIKKIINFYPTREALKIALSLGEVDKAVGIVDLKVKNSLIATWPTIQVDKNVHYGKLLTLFYNNSDGMLSNKKLRQALNFAIPALFDEGERAYSPISPKSIYFSKSPNFGITDLEIAKNMINSEKDVKTKTFEISADEEYKSVAQKISDAWAKIGIKSEIKTVSGIPEKFQILIYPINLPPDPDQYALWHSNQVNNIIKYKNMRIDKLLEDGRSTTDSERRVSIYSDFQKYLIDDVPASFLYFPYEYVLTRK